MSRKERKAAEARQRALAAWQHEHDEGLALLEVTREFSGTVTDDLMLAADERVFLIVEETGLVEDRQTGGSWEGRSSGVSIPVGSIGGRSVRWRVGQSKGHYVQGQPVPTAIDTGTTFISNQRVVFRGIKQTRECPFKKLIGVEHLPAGATVFSLSIAQKPTVIAYGSAVAATFGFRLELALAHFRN